MKRILGLILAVLPITAVLLSGCAAVIPDWHSRPSGLGKHHDSELLAWSAPRWSCHAPTIDGCEVRVFFRLNHYEGPPVKVISQWDGADPVLHDAADRSWVLDHVAEAGRHRTRIWIALDGSTLFYAEVWITVTVPGAVIEPARLD